MSLGKQIGTAFGGYAIFKAIINLFIGGITLSNLISLGLGIVFLVLLLGGVKYAHFICGAITGIITAYYLPGNIANIGTNWMYLLEGIIDIAFIVLLFLDSDVQEVYAPESPKADKNAD